MNTIVVKLADAAPVECPFHTPVTDLVARAPADPSGLPYIGALVNNDLTSLSYPMEVDSDVRLLTMSDSLGWKIYARSVSFLLAKAAWELYPESMLSVSYSIGTGFYCLFEPPNGPAETPGISPDQVARIETRMRELVDENVPIERQKLSFAKAVELFQSAGQTDRLNLLKFRNPPRVVIHVCGKFYDLAQGPLANSAGCLGFFKLIPHAPGFVLQLPDRDDPRTVPAFHEQPHLFRIFEEHRQRGRVLGVTTVGRLNEIIAGGEIREFIHITEAMHEKDVARIADAICARGRVKLVLLAGPSSAGKTTLSKRLAIQLRVNGVPSTTLTMDNYFVEHDRTPRDEFGNFDFEHIDAVDIGLFNHDLLALFRGDEIQPPTFNFETKQREYRGERFRLTERQVVIVEGIHGLNPRLTQMIPEAEKFRIYVSAMTQLQIDSHNRISTTDNRLIRRMVRDNKFRGHSAIDSIRMWPSVRRGEERWIFPFQSEADAYFNSALDYELAVLKPMAEPLLMQVKPLHAEYAEARRLTAFLLNFLGIQDREVPSTSILREYIGRSGFRY